MRFQVPQFIEVEDKIFGPLTLKQFIYLVGGGATLFLLYIILPFFLFIIVAIPVGAFSAALSFFQVNNQPLIKILENAFSFTTKGKIYKWKKEEKERQEKEKKGKTKEQTEITTPKLTKRKLSDLAWSLDIKEEPKDE